MTVHCWQWPKSVLTFSQIMFGVCLCILYCRSSQKPTECNYKALWDTRLNMRGHFKACNLLYFFFLHFIGPQVYFFFFFFLHVTTLWWYEHCVRALLDFQCLFFNVNLFGDWSRNSGFSHNKTNEEVCVLVPRFGFWDVPRGLVLWNLLVYLPDLDSSLRCDEGSKSIKMYCHSSQTGLRHQILNKSVLCWQQWHKL